MTVIVDTASRDQRLTARNIAAEARGVEEGHQCRWDASRHALVVKSDTGPRQYVVSAQGLDGLVRFSCTAESTDGSPLPSGLQFHARQVPLGCVSCKHVGRLASRLSRSGLIRWNKSTGRWEVTAKAEELGR